MEIVDTEQEAPKRRKVLYEKHKKEFDFLDKLENLRKKIFKELTLFSDNDAYRSVIWFLAGKSSKSFGAIRVLCDQGYGEDANILCRSLYENLIYIEYISKGDKESLSKEYIEYNIITRKQGLNNLFKQVDTYKNEISNNRENIDEINDEYNKFILKYPKYKKNKKLFANNIEWLVKEINDGDLLWYYNIVYWLSSLFVHSRPAIANIMVEINNDIFEVSSGPSDKFVVQSIVTSFELMLRILCRINEVFDFKLDEEIENLKKEFINKEKQK